MKNNPFLKMIEANIQKNKEREKKKKEQEEKKKMNQKTTQENMAQKEI